MRASAPSSAAFARVAAGPAAAALLALFAGCGGPALRVESLPTGRDPAKVYFRPTHDREGNAYPASTPETYIGEMPTDWEIPESYLGGRAALRLEYPDGTKNDAVITLHKNKDTRIPFTKPAVPRK